MKKIIIFVLISLPIFCLISCESRPINPQILGTTILQEENGTIFAEIDTARYEVTTIFTGKRIGKDSIDEQLSPTLGLQVTCFTSKELPDVTFFKGKVTEEQIEKYYYKNVTPMAVIVIVFIIICSFIGTINKN